VRFPREYKNNWDFFLFLRKGFEQVYKVLGGVFNCSRFRQRAVLHDGNRTSGVSQMIGSIHRKKNLSTKLQNAWLNPLLA
jgi:hypothetical protein